MGLLLVLLGSLLIFWQTIDFDFVTYDDDLYVFHQATQTWWEQTWLERLATKHIGYPIPLVVSIYATLSHWYGISPGPFHVTNLFLHLLNVLLVYGLCWRISRSHDKAAFSTALWAFHPLLAEPVSWATGLKDILTLTGVIVAIWGVSFVLSEDSWKKGGFLIFLGALVAIGAKPTGVVVGPILGVMGLLYLRQRPHRAKGIIGVGFVLTSMGLVYAVMVKNAHTVFGGHVHTSPIPTMVAAMNLQLQNAIVPLSLGPLYSFNTPGVIEYLVALGLIIGLVSVIVGGIRANNPWLAIAPVWLVLLYLPVSNILPIARFTADSYMYAPLVAISLAWASLSFEMGRTPKLLAAAALGGLMFLSSSQASHWENGVTLWQRGVQTAVTEDKSFQYLKLGQALGVYGHWEEAIIAFEKGNTELYGHSLPFDPHWALAYYKLGNVDRARQLLELGLKRTETRTHTARQQEEYRYLESFREKIK